ARESRLDNGRANNKLMRLSNTVNASRNACCICSGVPTLAAGSGTPQCAVIGCPGHTGHTSFAALSQTVKTKSSSGAPGLANSPQSLLRKPLVGNFAASIWRRATGWTSPFGWLPALYAVNVGNPFLFMMASAIMERAELPVQRNSTWYRLGMAASLQLQHVGPPQDSLPVFGF